LPGILDDAGYISYFVPPGKNAHKGHLAAFFLLLRKTHKGGLAMRRLLTCQKHAFTGLSIGLLIIVFWVKPALGQEKTAAERLQLADDLCVRALKIAAEAREQCGCALFQEALALVDEASILAAEVAAEAENTGRLELAQSAYDMATSVVGAGVAFMREVCTYCPQTSPSLDTVECFEEGCSSAEDIWVLNNKTIETSLAAGAVPGGPQPFVQPPVENEPPIQAHEQPPAVGSPLEEDPPVQDYEEPPASPI
jgi:hypothetical protein